MRTTVTLEPDVEKLLRATMRESGLSFKQALNTAVRAGLTQRPSKNGRRFTQRTFSMGSEQYFRWDKALATAAAMEDEEISRKVALRK
jgi:hypothetical protein